MITTSTVQLTSFLYNHPSTTEIYTLSLHDALPISRARRHRQGRGPEGRMARGPVSRRPVQDRKSTRLNSSHEWISYAVFCLKKKKTSCGAMAGSRPVAGSTATR